MQRHSIGCRDSFVCFPVLLMSKAILRRSRGEYVVQNVCSLDMQ
jgi:hypothetical protein